MPTLQWWTRDDDVKAADAVPYRLLEELPDLGAGDPDAGNMLIHGDNLEALKALSEQRFKEMDCDGRIWWGKDGNNIPRIKRFLTEVKQGVDPATPI